MAFKMNTVKASLESYPAIILQGIPKVGKTTFFRDLVLYEYKDPSIIKLEEMVLLNNSKKYPDIIKPGTESTIVHSDLGNENFTTRNRNERQAYEPAKSENSKSADDIYAMFHGGKD